MYGVSGSLTDEIKSKMPEDDLQTINSTLDNSKQWLETHQNEEPNVYDEKMKECQDIMTPIITKLSQSAQQGEGESVPTGTGPIRSEEATIEEVD